jgi:uroporphyrinogen-III synthase
MSPPRRIWVTRTEPQARATAARLRAMGLQPVVAPVLEARAIDGAVIDLAGVDAIAFTSGHGVQAFAALCPSRDRPVFAVGEATAELARAAGFTHVTASGGGARGLAAAIGAARPRPALVLNPTTREPSADLAALLAAQGVGARIAAVYETAAMGAGSIPAGADAVLIHSAKAARIVAAAVSPARAAAMSAFAISEAAAEPLRALPFARIAAAPIPDEASLLDLLKG